MHKPEKCYPMQALVSIIGTLPSDVSHYLVELIQLTLNKSNNKIKNLSLFLNEAKNCLVQGNEVQVICDIIDPYSSVPINKALDVLIDRLNNDKDDLMKRTKLSLKDIYEVVQLCLSKCYFLSKNELELGTLCIIFYDRFMQKLRSEFGSQSHCRSIDLKSVSKNV